MMHFFDIDKKIAENKSFTAQLSWWGFDFKHTIVHVYLKILEDDMPFGFSLLLFGNLFNFILSWRRKRDHAGLTFEITILGLSLMIGTYDHRHWDDENDKWCVYEKN